MVSPQELAGIWLIFTGAALATLWLGLVVGRLLRPSRPTPEKLRPYECGEEPVGTSRVQYDVRIYVAALVFVIFDVEVALLFPTGMFLGKINNLRAESKKTVGRSGLESSALSRKFTLTAEVQGPPSEPSAPRIDQRSHLEPQDTVALAGSAGKSASGPSESPLADQNSVGDGPAVEPVSKALETKLGDGALDRTRPQVTTAFVDRLAWAVAIELALFFAVLLVAYAYLWACGDLDWVRPARIS
ncbi:MAG: NADH-quinone oxidoreductase subunit A [Thermoguttaceae bacterium]|nr:NADH-quinone oxidoreductase subunit A [Thermoguttaceae bacterium]